MLSLSSSLVWFHNHQCQGCHKYLIFDECQPLLFHRPNVQNVWKYCSGDWMSYKTADSRRFIERTFLDKVEHIHQKLFNRFYIFLIGLESLSCTFLSCFFSILAWWWLSQERKIVRRKQRVHTVSTTIDAYLISSALVVFFYNGKQKCNFDSSDFCVKQCNGIAQ